MLEEGARRLSGAGLPEPRRAALRLWSTLAGVPPGRAWLTRSDPAPPGLEDAFRAAVGRMETGEPEAYVVGIAGFRNLDLFVDRRVLIPRPETEGLVQHVFDWARAEYPSGEWGSVVDIGTGSGCIAISLAAEGRFSRVIATDASAAALDVAARNVGAIDTAVPVELRLGEGLAPIGEMMVDAVVSNPPYIAAAEYDALDAGVHEYEPREALYSGADGLEHTRQLLQGSRRVLRSRGLLALEIAAARRAETLELARQLDWSNARIEKDLFGRPRYLLATRE